SGKASGGRGVAEGIPPGGSGQRVTRRSRSPLSFENQKRWWKVPPCHLRARQTCDLTCLVKNQHIKFKGRVRAVTPGARSPWAESQYLDYIFDVELAPPILEVRRLEAALIVNATFPLPACESLEPLKYDVDFWEAGRPKKDFSGSRLPIGPSEVRTLDVLGILTVCPRKGAAAQRKPRPPAGEPPGSEEEEEEEDEDDRDVFRPYLKPPPFLEGTPSASAPALGEIESVEGGGSPAPRSGSGCGAGEAGAGGPSGSAGSSSSRGKPPANGYATRKRQREPSRDADVPLMPEVSEWAPLPARGLGGCPSASIWDAPKMRDLRKGGAQAPLDPEELFISLQTLVFATASGPDSLSGDEETSLGSEEEEEAAFLDPPGLGNAAPGSPEDRSCPRVRPPGCEPGRYVVRSRELCDGC
uniref:Uncharacterized protein n=1 Tax=Ornithorhynchus anatinus TaxID=9258 RepID=A0A6I8N555_ORNAN